MEEKRGRGPAKNLAPKTCHCGREFQPYRANAIHCSPECKSKGPHRAEQSRKRRSTPEGKARAKRYSKASRDRAGYDPARVRAGQLKTKHGMTVDEYDAMLEAQDGKCAVCHAPPPTEGRILVLLIDHDHGCCPQGRSCRECRRGLLCNPCNRGIRYMRDDPSLLESAARYLRSY